MAEVIVISSESDDEDIDADINPRSFTKLSCTDFSIELQKAETVIDLDNSSYAISDYAETASEGSSDDSAFQQDLLEATRRSLLETEYTEEKIMPSDDSKHQLQKLSLRSEEGKPKNASVKMEEKDLKESSSCGIEAPAQFFKGDKSLPVYDVRTSGCTYSEAVRVLLSCEQSLICTKQPLLVEENCIFIISLKYLDDPDDIKSDDNGHWIHNGRKTTYVSVWYKNESIIDIKSIPKLVHPDENSQIYSLVRTYYTHDPHDDFKRIFYHLFGVDKVRHDLCLVQYYFEGEPHEIHPRSHGNCTTSKPYVRSKKSLQDRLKESSGKATPKQALVESLQNSGGVLGAQSIGSIPKSRSQVRYHQSKKAQSSSSSDPLFSVMLQCKSAEPNSDEAFVRSVVAAPEPMAVLATNRQLNDMVRFLTDPIQHTVMGIDPTFNFGDFNVTPIAFRYMLLEHRKLGHSPIILGPLLVHQQKKFSSYHFFASTLISLCPSLKNIRAFGSDGEVELYKAFKLQLPNADHLRCFRHFRSNLVTKLTSLNMPSSTIKEFMKDIFGQTTEGIHEVGLVDAISKEVFDKKLNELHAQWDEREKLVAPHRKPSFFEWFLREKASDIKDSMLLPLRESAGLGSPPSPFYTNTSESLNSMLHEKVHYKKSEWPKFNEAMKELIKESYELVELSIIDHGDFKFRPQYQHLVVPQKRWFQMSSQQRQHHLAKVSSALLTESNSATVRMTDFCYKDLPAFEERETQILSLSVQDAGIQSLPKPVLDGIWNKAEMLLSVPGQVMEGPGTSSAVTTCYVVGSKSSVRPHIVQHSKSGQFSCEPSCAMWQSSKICSHCIAAAEFSGNLGKFLAWYKSSKSKPNLNRLSKVDMPKGTGRKGEKPPRKRAKGSSVCYSLVDSSNISTSNREVATFSGPVSSTNSSQNIYTQGVDWSWSASTPSQVSARSPFLPSAPWMYVSPQMQPMSYPHPFPNDYQSWSCSPSMPPIFPVNSPPHSPFGYPWAGSGAFVPQTLGTQGLTGDSHPFFIRFIGGNIRMCQGCKSSVRLSDGSIPSPPDNIVVARLEKRRYFDKNSGEWCYSHKESHCHYHARLSCIVRVEPLFVPRSLQIPQELKQSLQTVHIQFLASEFGITV